MRKYYGLQSELKGNTKDGYLKFRPKSNHFNLHEVVWFRFKKQIWKKIMI